MSNINMFIVTLFGLAIATAYVQAEDCIGCPISIDPNEPHLRVVITEILAQKDAHAHLVKVIKATIKILQKSEYTVEFEAQTGDVVKICNTTFIEYAWNNKKDFTIEDFECHSK